MFRRTVAVVAFAILCVACGRGETTVDPGPGQPETTAPTTTTGAPDADDGPTDDVETDDVDGSSSSTTTVASSTADETTTGTATTIVVNPDSENADAYTELGASGLVLTLDEQACADRSVDEGIGGGDPRLDALITAVKECASPAAVDAFASVLLSAGGDDLPPNEAACVASTLRSNDDYGPFWAALFDEEPFDFLAAETDVQNLYLGLFSDCVSVGRALSSQVGGELSVPSIDCIDRLYADSEFVRVTIEADLSGDADEVARINQQIGTCLTSEEQDRLRVG